MIKSICVGGVCEGGGVVFEMNKLRTCVVYVHLLRLNSVESNSISGLDTIIAKLLMWLHKLVFVPKLLFIWGDIGALKNS